MIEGLSANIVAVAENVRVGMYTAVWLMKHGLLSEDYDGSTSIFTPAVVNCADQGVELLIMPNRFQLAARGDDLTKATEVLRTKLSKLLVATNSTVSFSALGLNYEFGAYAADASDGYPKRLRTKLFAESPFLATFDPANTSLGFSAIEECGAVRRQTDIKPVQFSEPPKKGYALMLNFHMDCKDQGATQAFVERMDEFVAFAGDRVNTFDMMLNGEM